MKKTFKCDCSGHLIEFIYDEDKRGMKGVPMPILWINISDIYGPKRKYKKPKLAADIVLMNSHYPKELEKFLKFMQKAIDKYKLTRDRR